MDILDKLGSVHSYDK